jgi:IclR family transcriptional regulator, acetate operon repressor
VTVDRQQGLVSKAVTVLRAISCEADGITLSEISRATLIPKATCLRIATDLVAEMVVVVNAATKRYGIALGALALVSSALSDEQSTFRRIRVVITDLAAGTGETSGLDILDGENVLVLTEVAGNALIGQQNASVPRQLDAWRTSTGKVLLAGLEDDEVAERFARDVEAYNSSPAVRFPGLLEELEAVRRDGYASAIDELSTGATAVAAPVVVGGKTAAAVWIGGPSFRLDTERILEVAPAVQNAARAVADMLTMSGGSIGAPAMSGPRGEQ